MAEIKVRLTGDNADFQKKLREASEESRVAALEMKEQFGELAHRAGDIAGEAGLGRIGGVLKDLAGGAVLAFGTALVGAIAEGVKEASKFIDLTTRLGIQLGNMQAGKEMSEYIEKLALAGPGGPNKEALSSAANVMLSTGQIPEERVREWIPRIQRLSAATGIPAEQWGEMIAGGSVGITRGLEHNPVVRGAMAASGIKDPLEALGRVADTTYATALTTMSSTPGGRFEGTKRQIGDFFEKLGAGFLDPTSDPFNYYGTDRTSTNRNLGIPVGGGIYYGNPGGMGINVNPHKELMDAAKTLKDAADLQKQNQEALQAVFGGT